MLVITGASLQEWDYPDEDDNEDEDNWWCGDEHYAGGALSSDDDDLAIYERSMYRDTEKYNDSCGSDCMGDDY